MKNFKMVATHVAELMKNLKKNVRVGELMKNLKKWSTSHRENVTYLYLK